MSQFLDSEAEESEVSTNNNNSSSSHCGNNQDFRTDNFYRCVS